MSTANCIPLDGKKHYKKKNNHPVPCSPTDELYYGRGSGVSEVFVYPIFMNTSTGGGEVYSLRLL